MVILMILVVEFYFNIWIKIKFFIILNYFKTFHCFSNTYIFYKIILTIFVNIASLKEFFLFKIIKILSVRDMDFFIVRTIFLGTKG